MRADVQKRIAQIGSRLQASAVVQEGDTPPEDPARLLAELTAELERQIDVAAPRRELDDFARERRELDTSIQEHNWSADLIEDASR